MDLGLKGKTALVLGAQRLYASYGIAMNKSDVHAGVASSLAWTTGQFSFVSGALRPDRLYDKYGKNCYCFEPS